MRAGTRAHTRRHAQRRACARTHSLAFLLQGEEITIQYVADGRHRRQGSEGGGRWGLERLQQDTTAQRRAMLRERFDFLCECPACKPVVEG